MHDEHLYFVLVQCSVEITTLDPWIQLKDGWICTYVSVLFVFGGWLFSGHDSCAVVLFGWI